MEIYSFRLPYESAARIRRGQTVTPVNMRPDARTLRRSPVPLAASPSNGRAMERAMHATATNALCRGIYNVIMCARNRFDVDRTHKRG